jgi:hypothetical protein
MVSERKREIEREREIGRDRESERMKERERERERETKTERERMKERGGERDGVYSNRWCQVFSDTSSYVFLTTVIFKQLYREREREGLSRWVKERLKENERMREREREREGLSRWVKERVKERERVSERERESEWVKKRERVSERARVRESERERERKRERERGRERGREREWESERDRERGRERERERESEWVKKRERERERVEEREKNIQIDGVKLFPQLSFYIRQMESQREARDCRGNLSQRGQIHWNICGGTEDRDQCYKTFLLLKFYFYEKHFLLMFLKLLYYLL